MLPLIYAFQCASKKEKPALAPYSMLNLANLLKENECYFKYGKNFEESTSRVAKSTKASLTAPIHILLALFTGWGCCQVLG